jgi:hypothetical protein
MAHTSHSRCIASALPLGFLRRAELNQHMTSEYKHHHDRRPRRPRSCPRIAYQPRCIPDYHCEPSRLLPRSRRVSNALEHHLELPVYDPIMHLGLRTPQYSWPTRAIAKGCVSAIRNYVGRADRRNHRCMGDTAANACS